MLLKNWGSIYPDIRNKKIPVQSVAFYLIWLLKPACLNLSNIKYATA